ncbi:MULTISPECIES: UDP-glucose 4-epimerase GalE [Fusobacterium]|jgi:UDP-glucose 4-epimerase|uniref:UDP-glucose 4-epimerase n=1 Tax=Fusobacterium varium ATCC 27725 TaxID=469618 RepID=A0ABN5JK26_FUSVA|nr:MULTISPECIES: UDP-glucose 4-epimerase GalE [Fusobacterium]AVQ31464.1 UDP-glucose 4-epimerase GalE [Fusobacterium varium ATCC 27725]EES62793.1 UDP-glucose 4-epimerase [Fusobacterium varium ATCC 27725]MCF0170439.1 UDP-glucose 4-epimerase GalE [Fusobacterium varium]MCF2673946.1 UDP-glucose 4-epimerase GalE [Fusobacterium varium]MCI6034079.1 UDP-glucose 4-epimerase GalE [Fusobacterium varium]
MKNILVTGGAGYIGSHAVAELLDSGYSVVVIDSLENGFMQLVDKRAKFYHGNVQDADMMDKIFTENKIDAVMHFAGYIKVPESVVEPNKYYLNNTYTVMCLLESMKKNNIKNIVFSSTAAVYGDVKEPEPVDENHSKDPINPYGMSKLMSERIIMDCAKAHELNYSIFRYFNVGGAHEKHDIGQMGEGITALIPLILKAAKGTIPKLSIYGNDFNTKDGTGVRDYIHVVDLVRAHILSLKTLEKNISGIYNLGNGNGFTVLEMLNAAKEVTKIDIPAEITSRRPGDPPCVIASSKKAIAELGWKPYYTNVKDIIRTAWEWNLKVK